MKLPRPLHLRYADLIDWSAIGRRLRQHSRDLDRIVAFKAATEAEAVRLRIAEAVRPEPPLRIPKLTHRQQVIFDRHATTSHWLTIE